MQYSAKSTIIFFVVLMACCFLQLKHASAVNGYPSFGVNLMTSGNGLALAPAFTARYSFANVEFDLGANFQIRESRFSGYQANVYYYVTPWTRKVRLGFFAGVRYFHSASLKKNVAAQETWKQPEADVKFDELKLRCIEGQAGFGLRVHHSPVWNSFYGVGFGVYHTPETSRLVNGMHRQFQQMELTLNFGFSYSIR